MNYETPQVVDYGTLVSLTAGQLSGPSTDAAFPIHTPAGDITFS